MGQKLSTVALEGGGKGNQGCLVPSYVNPWSLVVTETVEDWAHLAGAYGFNESPYRCTNRDCDRDSICLRSASAILKRSSCNIEVQRFHETPKLISYSNDLGLKNKISSGFLLNEVVAAMKDNLVLLIFYRWERLQYEAVFVLVDLQVNRIIGHFDSPLINMSIMECKISPDGSTVAVLFYLRYDITQPFTYDLYIYSAESFKLLDVIHCNKEVRPYVTFDPRYRSSRIAIVNYYEEDSHDDRKYRLVIYCLRTHKIIATSPVVLSVIYGGGYFCVNFSKDGRYLILQRISDHMNGAHCYADSYIFTADELKLTKHYFANLTAFSTLCGTNYAPLFSHCGSRMCILNEEVRDCGERRLNVTVYQMPRPLSLKEQCRIVILQNIKSVTATNKLPLPRILKEFLNFTPSFR